MPETVFLDACVLYPRLVRDLVLGAARLGLLRPAWSPRVLEEWRIAAAREGLEVEDAAREAAGALRLIESGIEAAPDPVFEAGLSLPDPADSHVMAAAVAAGATTLLTFNLRDFPARRLAPFGVAARHPDGYFWELLSREPALMRPLLDELLAAADRRELGGRKLLRKAGLPRLGKAWEAG